MYGALEPLGVEGFLYGYELEFLESGVVLDVKDRGMIHSPMLELKEDGIYALGVELYAEEAEITYGYYRIDFDGRGHTRLD